MNIHKINYLQLLTVFIFLTQISQNVDCARILGVFPFMGKSHFLMFEKIMKELAARGHEVDVYSHFPQKTPIKGYHDVSLEGTIPIITGNMTLGEGGRIGFDLLMNLHYFTVLFGTDLCTVMFDSPQMNELKNKARKYDLVLTELFSTECMLGWAWYFKAPSVVLTSSVNLPWASDFFGFPDNPGYIPSYFTDAPPKMNLFQRVYSTVKTYFAKIYYRFYCLEPCTKLAREFFGEDMPHLNTLAKNSSLQLVNAHFSINHARPLTPNIIDVAGIQIGEPKPLNEHFSKLVQLGPDQKGVIYFTLGSLVQTETFPEKLLQGMFNAFSRLPYKVLWKARKEKFSANVTIPDNISFEWWMPQLDILCHPNTKLYISHGGNMGTQESVYCGVPVLGLPLFGDQDMNIAQLEYLGTAIRRSLDELNEDDLYSTAYKLLNDPKYQLKAKKVSKIFKDRPMAPLDTAIYWIEYVMRHEGAPQLRSLATELSWYQYHLLDVIFVLFGAPLLLVYLVYRLVKKAFVEFVKNGKNSSSSGGKNKKKRKAA